MLKSVKKQVTDLNLVAYLLTVGFKPTANITTRFTLFEFERSPEIEEAITKFYDRNAKVDALTLCENLRTIKAMVQELRA